MLARPARRFDGITAGDYLAWFRDPEPVALGRELRSIRVVAEPLGDTIAITLSWSAHRRRRGSRWRRRASR